MAQQAQPRIWVEKNNPTFFLCAKIILIATNFFSQVSVKTKLTGTKKATMHNFLSVVELSYHRYIQEVFFVVI